jgi:hypothetical protein
MSRPKEIPPLAFTTESGRRVRGFGCDYRVFVDFSEIPDASDAMVLTEDHYGYVYKRMVDYVGSSYYVFQWDSIGRQQDEY